MIRAILTWATLAVAVVAPIAAAAGSPLLAWRDPVYIAAGFAGVGALGLMFVLPVLIGGYLPGLSRQCERRMHRWIGGILVVAVLTHVAGLWMTSPPDVVDAFLFRTPTPFSAWGVIAFWAVLAIALVAALRQRLRLRPRIWRSVHVSLAVTIVVGSAVHAILIEGTMETVTKTAVCMLVLATVVKSVVDLRVFAK